MARHLRARRNGRSRPTVKAKKTFGRAANDMRVRMAGMNNNVTTYVKRHPIKTLSYSLLAGAILAQLMRMGMRIRHR